ncbi:ABC transporter ATP-binding protein [Streptococcus macedonicus]|uniref:ABC transporter ATP-binding protein n=1 Tax=Streptococcus macedonicus TaxID=59310 RepID=UPI0018993761|nr:ABC transporter ATP-binding protein [Streptococcus macedonicus]MBF6976608.1 ABC transporter ATP-binding protein [Streptococcus macedonicus]MBT1048670.1 ABC transporter ATP-binding protein [Streptococcus macedonicus]
MRVKVTNLQKSYKGRDILKDISFTIKSGTICGLLGVNGAGKSTIMKILFGLEKTSSGNILFDEKTPQEIKKSDEKLGALIESPAIYMNLSAFENLKTRALLYDIPDSKIKETLALIGLVDTGRKKAGKLSLGMKQRLGIGMAIITNPEFLILDEPTNGLDPDGIQELLELITSLKRQGMTILISSHQLHEISQVADDIMILHNGEIRYNQPNHHQDLENLFFTIVHGGH